MEVTGKVLLGNLLLGLAILKLYGCQDVSAEWEMGNCVFLEIDVPNGTHVSEQDHIHLKLMGWRHYSAENLGIGIRNEIWRMEWRMEDERRY